MKLTSDVFNWWMTSDGFVRGEGIFRWIFLPLVGLGFIFSVNSCIDRENNAKEMRTVRNAKATVITINGESQGLSGGKFPVPQVYTVALCKLESSKYKGKYFEVNSRDNFLEKGWAYNHSVNDTVTFPEIDTSALFDLKARQ